MADDACISTACGPGDFVPASTPVPVPQQPLPLPLVGESEKVGLSVCVCPFYQVFESKFVYAIGADIDSTSRAAKLHVEEGDILAAVNGTSLLTSDQPFEVFRDIIVKTRPVTLTFISPDSFPLHPLARMIKH